MFDGWDTDKPLALGAFVYDRPANVAALEARVKELEGEKRANEGAAFERGFQGGRRDRYKQYERETAKAVAAERERCVEVVRKHGISPFPIDDPNPNAEEINATLQNITAAIRKGGER